MANQSMINKNAEYGNISHQYVGARYVPKFFQNTQGTAEWVANVPYEPLTIVTYLGNSYTSKIPVPSGIGSPNNNPTYWALTGNYNAQVDEYRSEVETYTGLVNSLNNNYTNSIHFTTPELFGAIGDGITDDTLSIQNAINSGLPVIASKKYKITSTLIISAHNIFILSGFIIADNCDGIKVKGNYNKIFINSITGSLGFKGIILISDDSNADNLCAYNNISMLESSGFSYCVYLNSKGDNGIQYNNFYLGYLIAIESVISFIGEGSTPWISQNNFYNGRFRGKNGIVFSPSASQTDPFNNNNFYGVGFEGISVCMITLNFSTGNNFINVRSSKSENPGAKEISITRSSKNQFLNFSELDALLIDDNGSSGNLLFENHYTSGTILYGDNFMSSEMWSGGSFYCDYISDTTKNKVLGYGSSTTLVKRLPAPANGIHYEIGGDSGQNLTHTISNIFNRRGSYMFINCASKAQTCTIKFVAEDGSTLIDNLFTANTKYFAFNSAGKWYLITLASTTP